MAALTNEEFYDKWVPLLADNVFQDINGARFQELLADMRDSFASMASQNAQPVAPAVNFDPVLRQLTATHLLGTSELEYNQNNGGFTAYAPIQVDDLGHGQGEWRFRVKAATGRNSSQTTDSPIITAKGTANSAGPGKIKAIDISDSTADGRALLTAQDVAAQRKLLDNFVILAGQYGVGQPRFEHTTGEDGLYAYMLRALSSVATPAKPAAPTAGQVDDKGDTFSFQPIADYPSFAQYKVNGLPNTTGAEQLNSANCYVQNGRVYVRVNGAVDKGGLAVYVGASGSIPDGRVLTNDTAFTANNVVPTVPGALAVDFTVDNASLSPGDTLTFTAKASSGTAPYQHSVQALNPDTGTVTVLGTASSANYTGTWKAVAGVYLVTDAVTDTAGASLVSVTRRVVVAYPGSGGGGVPLTPATTTKLGGIIISDGLTVQPDGTTSVTNPLTADQAAALPAGIDASNHLAAQSDLFAKADLDPNSGRLAVGQGPGAGFGLLYDPVRNEYAYNDGVLFTNQKLPNSRVDPATGQIKTVFGYTTLVYTAVPQGVTLKSNDIKLLYASYQNYSSGTYLKAWYREPAGNTIAFSDLSTTPLVPNNSLLGLVVSVLNADVASLHIAPLSGYDDTNLKAELAKRVKTVNGVGPDAAGNVQVAASTAPGTGGPGAATAADVQAGTSSDTYISPQALAQSSEDLYTWVRDVPEDVQSNVENTANWDAYSRYLGPAVPAGLNGKIHYFMPAAGLGVARYKFEFIEDNQVVRYLISTNP